MKFPAAFVVCKITVRRVQLLLQLHTSTNGAQRRLGLTWYLEVEEGAPPAAHLLHAVEVVGQVRRRQHAQHRDDVVVDDGEDVLQVLALFELRARLLVDVL